MGNLGIGIDTSIASAEEVLNATLNQDKPKKKPEVKPISDDDKKLIDYVKECETVEALEEYYKGISGTLTSSEAKKELVNACKKRKGELLNG